MSRQGFKRAAFYATALIIFLVLLSPYVLDQLLNSSFVKDKISSAIEQKTGVKIDQENIDFLFFPQPGIRFRDQEISFNKIVQLNIGAVNIDLDIGKFIKGKLAVSKINIESPHIRLTPPKNGQDPQMLTQPFQFKFPKQEVQQLFALFPDSRDTLELVVHNIQTDYFDTMDGSLFVSNTNQSLVFKATIHGLNLRKNQFHDTSSFQKIDISFIRSDQLILAMELDRKGILNGKLQVKAPRVLANQIPDKPIVADSLDFEFQFSQDYLSVRLNPVVFSYPKAKVDINFIDNRKDKKAVINFTGDDIDIAQARQACLKLMGSNTVVSQLFDILREGTARNVTVGFSSNTLATLFDGKNLYLTGSAENSLVKIPETPIIAKNVHGGATLKNGILHVKARKGQVSTTVINEGWLDIDLLNHENIPFKGEFKLHSDLSTLPQVLISLLPDTLLANELARVGEITGQADALLKLGMDSQQKELFVQVEAQNISVNGFYDRIPMPISITKGQFFYEADEIILKDFSGGLKDSFVENLNAVLEFNQTPHFVINTELARFNLAQIMGWLRSFEPVLNLISPVKNIDGKIFADSLKLEGPVLKPEKWQFEINGSGKDINIGFAQGREKKKIINQVKEISGRFHVSDKKVQIQEAQARIENLSWLSYAINLQKLSSIVMPIELFGASFETETKNAHFQGQLSSLSGPQLSFDLIGKNIKDLYPRLISIKDNESSNAIIILNKDTAKPLLNFDGTLSTQTLEKLLIKGSFLHNRLVSFTGGEPVKIFTDANSNLHVDMNKINIDSFGSFGTQKIKSQNQPLFYQKNLYLNAQQLTYQKNIFSNIDARINFDKDKTTIQILHGSLCNLLAKGVIELVNNTQNDQVITDFKIQPLENQDLSDILSCLFKTQNIIDGPFSFTSKLSGNASSDTISRHQNGTLIFNASNGRIYKWTFLSRLLSVLNILHFADITKEGIGYKTILIEADIKDSIIYLKKGIIDADNMALIFSGWIDPIKDQIDLTCLVAPFKTIDSVIKFIPVVNTMLSGRLVSFPAKATGSMTNPVVIPLHPSAVGKGLVNMLGDILKTPVRLFEETP